MNSTVPFEDLSDPYHSCEDHCNHDLVRGVLTADLFGEEDGDYGAKLTGPPAYPAMIDGRIQMVHPGGIPVT